LYYQEQFDSYYEIIIATYVEMKGKNR